MELPDPSEGARDESWAVLIAAHIPERWWEIPLSQIQIPPSVTLCMSDETPEEKKKYV